MEKVSFSEQVYSLCKKIPPGKVTTYGEMARALGIKGYQAVGQALNGKPYSSIVPCHRVVKSDGSLGGFKGSLEEDIVIKKMRLLEREGVILDDGRVDLGKYLLCFSILVEKNI